MHPNSKAFKRLQAVWDKKLKNSGFIDAECRKDERLINNHGSDFITKYKNESGHEVEAYYTSAGSFLYAHTFKNPMHKKVWELHCQGKSSREIGAILGVKGNKTYISVIIARLAKEMKASW